MSTSVGGLRSRSSDLGERIGGMLPRWAWLVFFFAIALVYPYVAPDIGGSGLLDASINSLAYIVMALGLNIVVGFAGLLDLGYVAFFAIGAFVMGWLGSAQFADINNGN